jgi:hypothetical protein
MGFEVLTRCQVDQFVEQSYTIVEDCLPAQVTKDWCDWCEERLRMLPANYPKLAGTKSELPALLTVDATKLSLKAWRAACDLVGGADRVLRSTWRWTDAFIVNLPAAPEEPWSPPPLSSGLWHLDSHWFRCFLDSPEWALISIVVWRDIEPGGGATVVSPEAVPGITKWYAEHPEGSEQGTGLGVKSPSEQDFSRYLEPHFRRIELTARAGDVIFLSRNLLHAQSRNTRSVNRIITRPSITLREPLCLNRPDKVYSAVERNVLNALGTDKIDFQPIRARGRLSQSYELSEYEKRRQVLRDLYRIGQQQTVR